MTLKCLIGPAIITDLLLLPYQIESSASWGLKQVMGFVRQRWNLTCQQSSPGQHIWVCLISLVGKENTVSWYKHSLVKSLQMWAAAANKREVKFNLRASPCKCLNCCGCVWFSKRYSWHFTYKWLKHLSLYKSYEYVKKNLQLNSNNWIVPAYNKCLDLDFTKLTTIICKS